MSIKTDISENFQLLLSVNTVLSVYIIMLWCIGVYIIRVYRMCPANSWLIDVVLTQTFVANL